MKIIEGDLIMTEDMTLNDDLKVNGNIYGNDGIPPKHKDLGILPTII